MGGAIASVAAAEWNRRISGVVLKGLVLVAPMCGIDPSMVPQEPVMTMLRLLAAIVPKAAIIPGDNDINNKSIKDPAIRNTAASDPLEYGGRTRLRLGLELMRGCSKVSAVADQLTTPTIPDEIMSTLDVTENESCQPLS